MTDERLRRPDPERLGPHRDFANILRRAGAQPDPDDPHREPTVPPAGDFVTEGVRAAYQVVDTYLRQGQRVAQSFGRAAYEPLGMGRGGGELWSRWMVAVTELWAIWFEMLGTMSENMTPAMAPRRAAMEPDGPRTPASPFARTGSEAPATPRPAARAATAFEYEISSHRPARVRADFLPGLETDALAAHDLRCLEGGGAPIPVAFEPDRDGHAVVVRIAVPPGQPAGLYTGALLHAQTGEAVGNISLQLR